MTTATVATSRFRLVLALVVGGITGFVLFSLPQYGVHDFQAFYCAGRVLRAHADPYKAQPLGTCEHRLTDGTNAALAPSVTLPAPQPGYDLAAFSLLSLMPFSLAKAVWGAIEGVALVMAALALRAVARVSLITVFLVLVFSLVYHSLVFGQVFGLFAAAVCAAAVFAERKRWNMAAIAAALSLVEPHLGVPVCAALMIWKREARISLAVAIAGLAAVSMFALGYGGNVEYARIVLPLHALSELGSDAQLSASVLFNALGFPASPAVFWGMVSYMAAAAAGIVFAGRLSLLLGKPAMLVFVPCAFAVIGGAFIHVTEMFAAIPLALVLMQVPDGRIRRCAFACLLLLAVPWLEATYFEPIAVFALFAALIVGGLLWENVDRRWWSVVGFAAVLLMIVSARLSFQAGRHTWRVESAVPAYGRTDAEFSWSSNIAQVRSAETLPVWALRAPTWTALLLLAGTSIVLARKRTLVLAPASNVA